MLTHLLGSDQVNSAIVLIRTRSRADPITKLLIRDRFKAIAIHGGCSQSQRSAALAGCRAGHYAVLLATNVAACLLDIPEISQFIIFVFLEAPDSYIHRMGRTASMDRSGDALSLVMPRDGLSLRGIEQKLGSDSSGRRSADSSSLIRSPKMGRGRSIGRRACVIFLCGPGYPTWVSIIRQ
jgi:superfamily II DNA/RNA helicase